MLPLIWMLLALLARIAEKAQSETRLPETTTLAARKALMPLPFCPVPPLRAPMRSTRLPVTSVPYGAACQRWTRMPPLAQSETVLPAIVSPAASTDQMPASAAPEIVVRSTRPAARSSASPFLALPVSVQLSMAR